MEDTDQDTSIVVCVTIMAIAGVGGYALSLGYNHLLPSVILAAISGIGAGYYAYKKSKREYKERKEILQDDDEGETGAG